VRDIAPGPASSSPSSLIAAGGRVFFAADDGVHGVEPWVSDGTEGGTQLVQDLSPGPASSSPSEFARQGGTIYFTATDDDAGAQLWSMPADADATTPPRGRPRDPRVVPPRN
jgi:ELWxxDGT repeat protein